jgi:hypothetical protein
LTDVAGFARVIDPRKPNQFAELTSPGGAPLSAILNITEPNYAILDTDYTSYAVVYICDRLNDVEILFVTSRTSTLQNLTRNKLNSLLNRHTNIDFEQLNPISQQNCPPPPTPPAPSP